MSEYLYTCIDVETNGLNPNEHEIIEVFATEFNMSGEIGKSFHQMCCPMSMHIPYSASKVNNITMEMVADKPKYLQDGIQKQVAEFIGNRVLIGHNLINFDIKFLKIKPKRMEDTLVMCRKRYSGRNSLKFACKRLGITWSEEEAHRAEYDVLKTIELFCKINKDDKERDILKSQIPMFIDPNEVVDGELTKFGVLPSSEDRKMIATQAYSYSRISLFHQCPFKWYMQYIKKIKQPNADYLTTGKICHTIAEWSGDWCYKTLFSNKMDSYMRLKNIKIGDKTKGQISALYRINASDVTNNDFGSFIYDNPSEISKFFKDVQGKASLINMLDSVIEEDSYEKPSMPDMESYEKIMQEAINRQRCNEPDIINDVRRIMIRFYDKKDFSLQRGDVTITEKKLAFDKSWKTLSDFFANNVFFRGILDLIEYFGNEIIITDYKSSRKMMTEKEMKEDKQTLTYLLLVYMLLPKDSYNKVTLKVEYIRFNKSVEYEVVGKASIEAAAEKALKWINDSIQMIEMEMLKTDGTSFPPVRNEFCHMCHLEEDAKCPLFNKKMINNIDNPFEFKVSDIDDCQTAWKRIEVNKAEIKRLTSQCKSFVKGCTDVIKIDETAVLDFYTKEELSCETTETIKLLLEKDVDIKYIVKFMNINPSSLAVLCESKSIALTKEEVNRISKRKITTKFEAYTEKEAKDKKMLNS